MDFNPKHWRVYQQEMAEHQNSAKIPKLVIGTQNEPSGSALPLFVSEPSSKISTLSAFPDSTSVSTRFPRSYFSLAQWQELELQALIFRYILAGSTVPPELLQPIKKSFLHSSNSFFLHRALQHYSPYQSAMFQTGYWGREAMDPEPGRCRRTDGKKWRCSKDVVSGHKYCERHMHRGRNRSRKPVEIPTTTTTSSAATNINGGGGGGGGCLNITSNTSSINNASSISATASGGTQFALSGPFGSIDLLQLNQSSSENKNLFEPQNMATGDGKSDGHILRHFFDDWPRSLQESDNGGTSMSSSTCLSMSIPENSSSDVSLKLSTGNGDLDLSHHESNSDREHRQLSWAAGWPSNHMGGPLAEALRSSNSNSSPTSVLHQLPRRSVSETSFVSA